MTDFETAFCKACNATVQIDWTDGFRLSGACCERCSKPIIG